MLRPKQLVLATGMSGVPNVPHIVGVETFRGEQYHSSAFRGTEDYRGKKCVVLGSNNSAHDICAALWEQDADVTMIQRSSTHVGTESYEIRPGLPDALFTTTNLESGDADGDRRIAAQEP